MVGEYTKQSNSARHDSAYHFRSAAKFLWVSVQLASRLPSIVCNQNFARNHSRHIWTRQQGMNQRKKREKQSKSALHLPNLQLSTGPDAFVARQPPHPPTVLHTISPRSVGQPPAGPFGAFKCQPHVYTHAYIYYPPDDPKTYRPRRKRDKTVRPVCRLQTKKSIKIKIYRCYSIKEHERQAPQ